MGNEDFRVDSVTRTEYEELKKRISDAEERLHRGDITLALIDNHLKDIDGKLGDLAASIAVLKDKPGKRWEQVVTQCLTWALALILGYIALKLKIG